MSLFKQIATLPKAVKQYLIITGNYWAFTLTDGALRMLVVLYFHQLGYQPLAIAMLFLFYEVFGVITNLIGGWLGARIGLNKTMNIGLFMQVFALAMLLLPEQYLTIVWVMSAQALSGIAKDLNKMSAKSSIKTLVPKDQQSSLFKWVAILTGSKNALKGIGFFLGGLLLTLFGFTQAILFMAVMLLFVALLSVFFLSEEIGKARNKPKFSKMFSNNSALNFLSLARMCLFAARDVWFVVALPVYLATQLQWQHQSIGAFLALWIIGYGFVQSYAPVLVGRSTGKLPNAATLSTWGWSLAGVTLLLALLPMFVAISSEILVAGLLIFGGIFAINSSLHSYVIVAMAKEDGVSMDVGFYYMANAMGRLLGTILSGWIFQQYGLVMCLYISVILAAFAAIFIRKVEF